MKVMHFVWRTLPGMDVDGIDLSEIFMSMGLGGCGGMRGMGGMGTSHSSRRSQGRGIIKAGEMVIVHSLNKAKDGHAGGGWWYFAQERC